MTMSRRTRVVVMATVLALAGVLFMMVAREGMGTGPRPLAAPRMDSVTDGASDAARGAPALGPGVTAAQSPRANVDGDAAGIGPEPRYFKGQYANGNVIEEAMGSDAFERDMAALADAMSRDPDAAAFGDLQRQRVQDTMAQAQLRPRDVRLACGVRACLLQFTHDDARRIEAWWALFNALPPPRPGVVMSQPLPLKGGGWMQRVFLSFDPTVRGISSRPARPGP